MSLTKQVLGLLRIATEPQSTGQLREQLDAMHVANAGDVNKRVFWLVGKGVVEAIGKGRDTRYRIIPGRKLEEMEARQGARASAVSTLGRRKSGKGGAPTFRDEVIDVLQRRPGSMTVHIKQALTDAGIPLGKNEPSAALHVLQRQGRVRAEGNPPNRIYFLIDGADVAADQTNTPARPVQVKGANVAQADAQDGGLVAVVKHHGATSDCSGPTRRLQKSEISTDRSTPCGPTPPATTKAAGEASIPRTEGSAVTAGKDRHISDDPIDRLADAIAQHLELTGPRLADPSAPWITSTLIAEDLDEEPLDVARALRRLVDAKRVTVRTIGGVREYAFGIWASVAQLVIDGDKAEFDRFTGKESVSSIQTGPLSDVNGPISTDPISLPPSSPEITPGSAPDAAEGAAVAPIAVDAPAIQPPAYCPAEVVFVPDIAAAKAALSPAHQTTATRIEHLLDISDDSTRYAGLDKQVAWIRSDIEDLVGRACDRRADHKAIKAITTAAFALARAIEHLHTAGTTPASTGVPQS